MKKYIILLFAAATTLTSTGCMDDFLDNPSLSDSGSLSEKDAYNSVEGMKATMAGLLKFQRYQWAEFQQTDSGGLYSLEFARAVKGNDVIILNSWYAFDYQNENREPTYRRTQFTWRFPYAMIAKINQYIIGVENSTTVGDSDKLTYLSQAKALRGFYYYQLALEFNHAYKKDVNALAPPVYTEITTEGKPMSTLKELYEQIISDLEYAVDKGTTARTDNSWINRNVSAGILSNVYLSMEEWSKAELMAKMAYDGNVNTALNTVSTYEPIGFDDETDKEWLWVLPQRADQSNYYYLSPHGFMDNYNSGYKNGYINVDFVDKFANNDRRKEAFLNRNPALPKTDPRYYITKKFTFSFSASAAIFRKPEFVLVAAEAAYHQGNTTEANQILNDFKATRYTNYNAVNLAGNELLEEILLERRKELYAENGVEWFDAKRLQRGIKRTGNHHTSMDLEPNDKRFILKIPQIELDNNKHIDPNINANR